MTELKGTDRFDFEVVKLMRLMDMDNFMMQMFEIGLKAGIPQSVDEFGFHAEEFIERVQQKMDIDSILYQMVPIYSRYYTREEVIDLIAFYETPCGHKLIKESPQVMQETMVACQAWLERMVEKMRSDLDSIS